jgi:hypothetical protein
MVEAFVLTCLMYGHTPRLIKDSDSFSSASMLTCSPPPGWTKVRPTSGMRHPVCSTLTCEAPQSLRLPGQLPE